ncbi:MAG: hypothetical protein JNK48_11785 [Bryobacterales bacterium]|nr:hypothetical protein [Bryobacterales bacterium]
MMLQRIAECAVEAAGLGRTVTQIGPFRACIDPTTDLIYLNYVVPVWALGTVEETREQLERLRELFHASRRRLRFEFVDGIWPGLVEELEAFELERQDCLPLMACTAEQFVAAERAGVQVRTVEAGNIADLRAFYAVQRRAFGTEDVSVSEVEIGQLRHQIEHGFWRCVLASMDGVDVGVGSVLPWNTMCELAGVGTVQEGRRRGVAATLSSVLVREHFARGGDLVWLTAATEEARRVYAGIGFRDVGVGFHYIEMQGPCP